MGRSVSQQQGWLSRRGLARDGRLSQCSRRTTSGAEEQAGHEVLARVGACVHVRAWVQHGRGAGAPANGRNRTGILGPTLWHASDPPWMGAAAVRLGHANRTKKVAIY